MYIYKKIDNIMKNKEKASAFITQRELEHVVGSISIHEDGEWKQITKAEIVRVSPLKGLKENKDQREIDFNECLDSYNNVIRSQDLDITALKAKRSELIEMIDKNNLLIVEIKQQNKEFKEALDRSDAYIKVQFEEIKNLKSFMRIKDIIYWFFIISVIFIAIYKKM